MRGYNDDLANTVAGALVYASAVPKTVDISQLPTIANVGYPEFKRLRQSHRMRSGRIS
jgi:hypothetical protein